MNRRGFTLTELIAGLAVMALVGIALTRILISDSRFVSRQDAMLSARQGARAALNALVSELSMVGDDAVEAATPDSLTIRVPYAFGMTCRASSSTVKVISLTPVDSLVWASTTPAGLYWRRLTGQYTRLANVTVSTSPASDSTYCRADSVRVMAGGKLVRVGGFPASSMPDSVAIAMLYQRVTYKFATSSDLPGRRSLWRQMSGGSAEELVTPFDTSARFAYLIGGPGKGTLQLRTTAITGAGRDSIRGVELRLFAASEMAPQGTPAPQVFPLRTRVMFSNKVN